MEKQDLIAALLEKYWESETSLEEERMLKAYFNSGEVDPRFAAEAPLFRALREEKSVEWHRHTEVKPVQRFRFHWSAAASVLLLLAAGIWWWQYEPVRPVEKQAIAHQVRPAIQPLPADTPSVAASPEVKPAVKTLLASVKKRKASLPAVQSPAVDHEAQAAMEEIKAALALVSRKLKKGRTEAKKGLHEVKHLEIFKTTNSEG